MTLPVTDRVLITGASGFVGSAVVRTAVQRGYKVRALVRPSSPRANLSGLDCEIVEGDMRDLASMGRALKDTRFLFHVAADYRLWAPDPQEIYRNNLEGTHATMEAASRMSPWTISQSRPERLVRRLDERTRARTSNPR